MPSRGIASYKKGDFKVMKFRQVRADRNGNPVWAPYSDANRNEFDQI